MDYAGSANCTASNIVRRATRLDVRLKASLRETGVGKFTVDVINMSATGCRLQTSFTLSPGARVWITIPGLTPIACEISWKDMFVYGCRFADPLHYAVFDHIIARYRCQSD